MLTQNQTDEIVAEFVADISGDTFDKNQLALLSKETKKELIDFLEDGEALAESGIGNQDLVEEAHSFLNKIL